ncbi:MAG: accessory factor UbiK family protein [Pseudomonadota bacterium]
MQTRNRVLDDIAKVAGGAASVLAGVKDEIEALARARAERLLAAMELVTRDEFEAVRAMAVKARAEQERLAARLEALESAQPRAHKRRDR